VREQGNCGAASVTLARLLEVVGEPLLEPLALPHGLDVAIGQVTIYESDGSVPADGDLLLAVGVDPAGAAAREMLARCRNGHVLVIKHRPGAEEFRDAAARAGVTVLGTPPETEWAYLVTTLRAALVSAGLAPSGLLSAVPLGDLFALANTVADMVGGPVTIEDPHSRVLAFSHTNDVADEPRRLSILGRQVPPDWISDLRARRVFAELWSSEEPVEIPRMPEHGLTGRLAIAIRSGQEILGSIWVAPGDRPLPPHARPALKEAARSCAVHLLALAHQPVGAADETSRTVRAFLDGRTSADVVAGQLGLGAGAVALVTVALRDPVDSPDAAQDGARLASLALAHCRGRGLPAGASAEDGRARLILGLPNRAPTRLRSLLEDLAGRASAALRREVVAVSGQLRDRVEDLPVQQSVADQVLQVLRTQARDLAAATPDDVHAQMLLGAVTRLIEERPELQDGPVQELASIDAEHGTDYVSTLAAFLSAFGDVRVAADRVGVHPNTFRYRIRRIAERTGLRVDDPDERVAAALQLRFLAAQRDGPASPGQPAGRAP
jgi:PucR-like helix-turn-helix protein